MYQTLLVFHSLIRWLLLLLLVYSIYRAYTGVKSKRVFTKTDNALRHWTATVAHIQLIFGILVYIKSPIIRFFYSNPSEAIYHPETTFFSLIHSLLMLTAIVILTIGSALTKRKSTDEGKFKTMLLWFSITLIIIFVAVPWPFSPLAARPYYR